MQKKQSQSSGYYKHSSKGEYRDTGGDYPKEQQYSRWDDYEEDDAGYRDRSPHRQQKSHHESYRKLPPKSPRSRTRSSDSRSHSRSSASSRSPSRSLSPLPTSKHAFQKQRRKAPRDSDYRSASHSPPPPPAPPAQSKTTRYSSSNYGGSSNVPSAYRDNFQDDTFRDTAYSSSRQYSPESRHVDYNQSDRATRRYDTKNAKTTTTTTTAESASSSRDLRESNYRSDGGEGGSQYVAKERRSGYTDREYGPRTDRTSSSPPPPAISHSSRHRQKRRSV